MPQLAGDGWGAPGHATIGLGQAIASLGSGHEDVGTKESEFQDNMALVIATGMRRHSSGKGGKRVSQFFLHFAV
jgi:hypothetical protein